MMACPDIVLKSIFSKFSSMIETSISSGVEAAKVRTLSGGNLN
jgi:hypothetical protein